MRGLSATADNPSNNKNSSNEKGGTLLIEGRTLITSTILNKKGSKLGRINELILDISDGRIIFVIISFGGIYGFKERLTAVPWRLFRFNDIQKKYVLNIESNELYTAPGFDNNSWPETNGNYWSETIDEYYKDKNEPIVQ
ncbi:MAG: sporulation protein YlmC with PRC-barrel domain [Kangiellaceae bacterium]|jgi:sporulation protein YlmC with PRC-barrel domain